MSEQRIYSVPGISCEHCAAAIVAEVRALDGVACVEVDIAGRSVLVVGGADDEIRAAIDEAGYDIA